MPSFFPQDVLDEIWDLIEAVSEGFPTHFCRSEVGNYRPVSILCIVSKFSERAVYIQIESFLVRYSILYELQSEFRENYSNDSCLIHLTDHIKYQTSKDLFTEMVMLDLQKALDTVDH